MIFLNFASSVEALVFNLPGVCTQWHRGKTEKDQSPEYFKIFGKNTIFNEHPVAATGPRPRLHSIIIKSNQFNWLLNIKRILYILLYIDDKIDLCHFSFQILHVYYCHSSALTHILAIIIWNISSAPLFLANDISCDKDDAKVDEK